MTLRQEYDDMLDRINRATDTEIAASHGERVRQSILTAGVRLWAAGIEPSARRIGAEVQLTHAGVLHHFVTSERLKNAVAVHAVQMQESRVIVQLIGIGHAAVQGLSDAERLGHLNRARR